MELLNELKTRNVDGIDGLFIIITQDYNTKEVLMQAYANKEALEKTIETKLAHYYSTSRNKLWLKGESSGNTQKIREINVDCDGDSIIYQVEQTGGACHKGYDTCFFRTLSSDGLEITGEKLFNPEDVY